MTFPPGQRTLSRAEEAVLPDAPTELAATDLDEPPEPPVNPQETDVAVPETEQSPSQPRWPIWPHLVWETLLAAVLGVLVWRAITGSLSLPMLTTVEFWFTAAVVLLLATGVSLTVRAGVPQPALPLVAVLASAATSWLLQRHEWAWQPTAAVVVTAAILAGLLVGALLVLLHAPAWIVSIGVGAACLSGAIQLGQDAAAAGQVGSVPAVADAGIVWFVAAAVVSVLGGLLAAHQSFRHGFTIRRDRDAALRPGFGGGVATVLATAGATLLAGLAGVVHGLALLGVTSADPDTTWAAEISAITVTPLLTNPWLLAVPLTAVLLGGTSAFGRHGGVVGTALAVVLLLVVLHEPLSATFVQQGYWLAGAVGIGLVATRFVEACAIRRYRPR